MHLMGSRVGVCPRIPGFWKAVVMRSSGPIDLHVCVNQIPPNSNHLHMAVTRCELKVIDLHTHVKSHFFLQTNMSKTRSFWHFQIPNV